jgi:transcriptional regulator with XRE-family HTH domain
MALQAAQYSDSSPTQLAREFNLRFPGQPISLHAARKWLRGEAIPTQEKLRILARWLGVTAEWLRYDGANSQSGPVPTTGSSAIGVPSDLRLLEEMQLLDDEGQRIARELIRLLIRMGRSRH